MTQKRGRLWILMKFTSRSLLLPMKQSKLSRSGDWIDYGWCTGTPLMHSTRHLQSVCLNLQISTSAVVFCMKEPEIFKLEDAASHFTWNSWHMQRNREKSSSKRLLFLLSYQIIPNFRDITETVRPLLV